MSHHHRHRPRPPLSESAGNATALGDLHRAWSRCTEAQRLAFVRTTLSEHLPLVEDALLVRASWLCDICRASLSEPG